jgi:predicted HAD superfamily Cof-like phosphohydrolase
MSTYKEPNGLNDVAKFHDTFSLPIEERPIIPHAKRCELRVSLLQEELNELQEAIHDNDIVEIADALCDLQYVLSGAILEFGLATDFKSLFDEVQRSNMSKTCKTMDEALATQKYYLDSKGTTSFIEEKEGEFLVYRKEDKKVLKSINYSPADLKSIINKAI